MQRSHFKRDFTTTFIGILVLLLGATLGFGQSVVSLTAGPANATLPDGSVVPMWGYTCGAATVASCAPLNPVSFAAGGWSPVVITVPVNTSGATSLQINLNNSLTFGPNNANNIPTSLVIVGQL